MTEGERVSWGAKSWTNSKINGEKYLGNYLQLWWNDSVKLQDKKTLKKSCFPGESFMSNRSLTGKGKQSAKYETWPCFMSMSDVQGMVVLFTQSWGLWDWDYFTTVIRNLFHLTVVYFYFIRLKTYTALTLKERGPVLYYIYRIHLSTLKEWASSQTVCTYNKHHIHQNVGYN